MHKPLMSLLKASDDESLAPKREDIRKLAFLVGPRAHNGTNSTAYDETVLRKLSMMVGQPILPNGG